MSLHLWMISSSAFGKLMDIVGSRLSSSAYEENRVKRAEGTEGQGVPHKEKVEPQLVSCAPSLTHQGKSNWRIEDDSCCK